VTVTINAPVADLLTTSASITVKWTGSSGITNYQVYEQLGFDGTPVLVQSSRVRSFARTGVPGTTYCYSVIGFTNAGDSGTSDLRCLALAADDRVETITYSGNVGQVSAAGPYMGTLTVLDGDGEEATFTFTGRRVGVLFQKNAASGKAQIWLDGVLVSVLELYSRATTNPNFAWTSTVPDGEHTVRIVWTGTKHARSSGTAISVDGFAVIAR
jgi:hypothetical protein